jgi:hypothetical protein
MFSGIQDDAAPGAQSEARFGCSFEGPAGIGKTVLVDAARERARLRV